MSGLYLYSLVIACSLLFPVGILGQGFSYFFRPDGTSHGFNVGDPSTLHRNNAPEVLQDPSGNGFTLNPTLRFHDPQSQQHQQPLQARPSFEVQRIPLQQHHRFEEEDGLVRPSSTQQSYYFNGQQQQSQRSLYQPFQSKCFKVCLFYC